MIALGFLRLILALPSIVFNILRKTAHEISGLVDLLASVSDSIQQLRIKLSQLQMQEKHADAYSSSLRIAELERRLKFPRIEIQDLALELAQKREARDSRAVDNTDCGKCSFVFDNITGIIVFIIINWCTSPDDIASFILAWRDQTRELLDELLEWLMGAPAGLKLNHEMTVFLGRFFQYHIFIWIGYLSLIEPYLSVIIKAIICSCCFGFSVMLSLTVDAWNVLTLHTYCFYVYAAKIYNLQLRALMSFSRLFRGQ